MSQPGSWRRRRHSPLAVGASREGVLDVHLGGLSGLDLQERLATSGVRTPVVIITAHDDRRTRERASGPGPSST